MNRDVEAEHYFDQALETALLETEDKQVRNLFSNYQDFLNTHSKVGKAAMVNRLAGIFKVSLTGLRYIQRLFQSNRSCLNFSAAFDKLGIIFPLCRDTGEGSIRAKEHDRRLFMALVWHSELQIKDVT